MNISNISLFLKVSIPFQRYQFCIIASICINNCTLMHFNKWKSISLSWRTVLCPYMGSKVGPMQVGWSGFLPPSGDLALQNRVLELGWRCSNKHPFPSHDRQVCKPDYCMTLRKTGGKPLCSNHSSPCLTKILTRQDKTTQDERLSLS